MNRIERRQGWLRRAIIAGCALVMLNAVPAAAEPVPAAYFGMKLINTSLAPISPEEEARIAATAERLRERLEASGRYRFVDIAPVAERMDLYDNLSHCNGCDTTFAQELGAEVAISGEVQKTSNLILHISVYIRDAETAQLIGGGSADIRSNTDKSWRRGIDYIVKNRILKE